jgi:hypothetical protein
MSEKPEDALDTAAESTATDGKKGTVAARKEGKTLMLEEERETGSVAPATYRFWLANMGSPLLVTLLLFSYIVTAGFGVALTLWLGFWQKREFDNLTSGAYQGIYAGTSWAKYNTFHDRRELIV